ncbi:MAG: biotin--[acetyl-CoA-carboxylase] ligase [Saprospiraceae bacterium]
MLNTFFVGKVLLRFPELASTNDYLAGMLDTGTKTEPIEGMAVRADFQTRGRGQFGRNWESVKGENLTVSVLLLPHFLDARRIFDLNMAVALSLRDATSLFLPKKENLRLKWPNDLVWGAQKLAGILTETEISAAGCVRRAIAGIGLNVNQRVFAPELVRATSLSLITGGSLDLDAVQDALFNALEQRYLQLKAGRTEALRADYLQVLWGMGARMECTDLSAGKRMQVEIMGVDEHGRLLLRRESGIGAYHPGEVSFWE